MEERRIFIAGRLTQRFEKELSKSGIEVVNATASPAQVTSDTIVCAVDCAHSTTPESTGYVVTVTQLDQATIPAAAEAKRPVAYVCGDEATLPHLLSNLKKVSEQVPGDRERILNQLTLLGPDLARQIDHCLERLAKAFGADGCVLWGNTTDAIWVRTSGTLAPDAAFMARADTAIHAGTSVVTDVGSLLVVPLVADGSIDRVASLCVYHHSARFYTDAAAARLLELAGRLATELSWISAHNRLVAEHDQLRKSALIDPTTGLWSRKAFQQLTESELAAADRRGEALHLAVFDIRHLRDINDRYGHAVGDALLSQLARVLQGHAEGQTLGRAGDDEIAILLRNDHAVAPRATVERLVHNLRGQPLMFGGHPIPVEVRVGITKAMPADDPPDRILSRAFGAVDDAREADVTIWESVTERDDENLIALDDDDLIIDTLQPGSTFGGMYKLVHELSRGAMGVVYRATDLGLGRPVAIKVLRSDLANDKKLVEQFRAEAAILASIQHRNLVQVYSFGVERDDVYFVMELVEGQALSDVLFQLDRDGDHLGLEIVAKILEEIADALDAMHTAGLIHRDVKPANILLDSIHDRGVLVDVGIAKRTTEHSEAAGTPGFAAPEIFTHTSQTTSADVYGLASTIYMALTGLPPFGCGEVAEVVQRQIYTSPKPPSHFRQDLTDAVDKILLKALAPQPSDRYDSATAFAIALQSAMSKLTRAGALTKRKKTAAESTSAIPIVDATGTLQVPQTLRPDSRFGHTRGLVFRVLSRLVARTLGHARLVELSRTTPEFAEVLREDLPSKTWISAETFAALLEQVAQNEGDDFVFALGKNLVSMTLGRVLGADLTGETPASLLHALPNYWDRYFSWGNPRIEADDGTCRVAISPHPPSASIVIFLRGMLAGIVIQAGGTHVQMTHKAPDIHSLFVDIAWKQIDPATADTQLPSGVR